MGGFSIGDLFGTLKLDDSQFLEALDKSGAASALMKLRIADLQQGVTNLRGEMGRAGFNLQEFQGYIGKLRSQGLSSTETINTFTEALGRLQTRLSEIRTQQSSLAIKALPGLGAGADAEAQRINDLRRSILGNAGFSPADSSKFLIGGANEAIQQQVRLLESELAEYRSLLEAERLRTSAIRDRVSAERDYSALTGRIRAEQEKADTQFKRAKGEAISENERLLKPQRDADIKHERDMASMRDFYSKQAIAAEENVAKQRGAIEKQRSNDARKAQQEILDQAQGDIAARERLEREANERIEKENQDRRKREAAAYQQHWRDMQKAQALTTVGTTIGAAGAVGVGAGLFLAKDAAHFQDAMAKSFADIGDISEKAKAQLAGVAREVAKETGVTAVAVAENYAKMAKGGLTVAESLDFASKSAKFAVATNSELHESTKQVITIMESLQIPYSKVGELLDKLSFANNIARGSVDQLATALEGRSGAALRSAKVSLDEAIALTIALSKAGVTASQSQTFLTQVIEKLRQVAVDYGNEILKVGDKQMRLHDIVYLSDGTMRPFIQTLKMLDEAFKGRSAESVNKFFSDVHLGSARGGQALKIFLGVTDSLDVVTDRIGKTGGQMAKNFDVVMQSPLKQLEVLKANLTDLAITIGIPVVAALQSAAKAGKPFLDFLADLAAKFSELPQGAQTTIASIAGIGSVSLVSAGGLLVFVGHLIRMRADLMLLQNGGILTGLSTSVLALGASFLGWASGILAVSYALYKLHEATMLDLKGQSTPGKDTAHKMIVGPQGFPVPNPNFLPKTESEDKATDTLQAPKIKTNQEQTLDEFRTTLEKLKEELKAAFNAGDFSINPGKVLKQQLTTESVREGLEKFSTEFNSVVDKLADNEIDAINAGEARIVRMIAKGADPKLVMAALRDLDSDLDRYKGFAEGRAKSDTKTLALENASETVKAFQEKVNADLRTFTEDQRAVVQSLIDNLKQMIAAGIDPKEVGLSIRQVEGFYKLLQDTLDDTAKTQNKLTEAVKKYRAEEAKKVKFRPELEDGTQALERLGIKLQSPDELKRLSDLDSATKALGFKSQQALNLEAASARGLVAELAQLGPTAYEVHAALVKMWEAEAVAAHVSVEKVSTDAAKYYRQYKAEVENSVIASNRRWRETINEIGRDFRHLAGDFGNGIFDLLWPKTGTAKDPLAPLVSAFRDAFNSLSSYADPKAALDQIVKKIQNAGTLAEANAVAIRYFGESAGPQLARDIRAGTYSVDELHKAIDTASMSTKEFEKQTDKSANTIGNLWRALVRDITVMISKQLIQAGIAELLKWMFQLKNDTHNLGDILVAVWKKIAAAITGAKVAAAGGGAIDVSNLPVNNPNIPGVTVPGLPSGGTGVPATVPTTGGAGGSGSFGMGSFGNVLGAAGAIGSVVSAVTGVIGVFQSMHQETSLNAIEHNTRYEQIIFQKFAEVDEWDRFHRILEKFDLWGHIAEAGMNLLISKFDQFVIPSLQNLQMSGGGGVVVNIASMTVQGNDDPEAFVQKLKRLRVVSGIN